MRFTSAFVSTAVCAATLFASAEARPVENQAADLGVRTDFNTEVCGQPSDQSWN
ncbi:hypothetical protein M422DRAFT_246997 [Sphaerobolus stellatus SS14]|nr:hypothetical protein M422DRAFT_246997 [Sphaerobolus stellatus SS14]